MASGAAWALGAGLALPLACAQRGIALDNSSSGLIGGDANNSDDCLINSTRWTLPAPSALDPSALVAAVMLLVVYLFWAQTVVVERVLLASIHVGIAKRVRLPESVSGASLLALGGSSLPLLFINLASLSRAEASATGFAMVLGSAAINFLLVLPVCFFVSDWRVTPLYWWPLLRDLTVYLVGLAMLSVFLARGTAAWQAGEQDRADHCWAGEEALCCFQELQDDAILPRQAGVLTFREALSMALVYTAYLFFLPVHHRVKWMLDDVATWVGANVCCIDLYEDKRRNQLEERQRQQLEHQEREAAAQREVERAERKRRGKDRHRKADKSRSGMQAQNARTHMLQVLAADLGRRSPALRRAEAVAVFRAGANAAAAFHYVAAGLEEIQPPDLVRFVGENFTTIVAAGRRDLGNDPDRHERVEAVANEMLDAIGGRADLDAFEAWYLQAEARLVREMNMAFDVLDEQGTGEVSVAQAGAALVLLGVCPSKTAVRATREKLEIHSAGRIGRPEFEEWFRASNAWAPTAAAATAVAAAALPPPSPQGQYGDAIDPIDSSGVVVGLGGGAAGVGFWGDPDAGVPPLSIWGPEREGGGGLLSCLLDVLALPFRAALVLTTSLLTGQADELSLLGATWWFLVAVLWLAVLSWSLLFFVESIGLTLGIPGPALGSTVLAFGVNAPHLVSSVGRAMRVAEESARAYNIVRSLEHSIKGNVFDLLCGLPFAVLVASSATDRPVLVAASNLPTSIIMLLLLVVLCLVLWASARWQLNLLVCAPMLVLYTLWLVNDLLLADWAQPVPAYVLCDGCSDDMVCVSRSEG